MMGSFPVLSFPEEVTSQRAVWRNCFELADGGTATKYSTWQRSLLSFGVRIINSECVSACREFRFDEIRDGARASRDVAFFPMERRGNLDHAVYRFHSHSADDFLVGRSRTTERAANPLE
jgi:hypothetical protein